MQDNANFELPTLKRIPWNKGKLTGAKPPLRQKHVRKTRPDLHRQHHEMPAATAGRARQQG
jgi:hypothetical protein